MSTHASAPGPPARRTRPAPRPWNEDQVDLLVERWAAGASLADIAVSLGRTAPQVKAKIRDMRRAGAGDRVPMRRPRQSRATQLQLTMMWNYAVPTAEIAATLGISEASVRKRVERMRTRGALMTTGVERDRRARRHQRQQLAEWLAQNGDFGKRLSDASAELDVPAPRLSEDLDALFEAGAVHRETVAAMLPKRFSRERRSAILELARAGHSRTEIARRLGLTPSYVKDNLKYLRRSGALPPRTQPSARPRGRRSPHNPLEPGHDWCGHRCRDAAHRARHLESGEGAARRRPPARATPATTGAHR